MVNALAVPGTRIPVLTRRTPLGEEAQIGASRIGSRVKLRVLSNGSDVFSEQIHHLQPPLHSGSATYIHLVRAGGGVMLLTTDDIERLTHAVQRLLGQEAAFDVGEGGLTRMMLISLSEAPHLPLHQFQRYDRLANVHAAKHAETLWTIDRHAHLVAVRQAALDVLGRIGSGLRAAYAPARRRLTHG